MKELTRQIRKDVKELIEKVGGTENILNKHINELTERYTTERDRKMFTERMVEVKTTIKNQIDYFHYSKGM